MQNFFIASILTAFDSKGVIGTKVLDHDGFLMGLSNALEDIDFSTQRTIGQAFVALPQDFWATVSGGDAKHTGNQDDYVVRSYRGAVGLYLRREHAAPLQSLAAIVYTKAAYLEDPQVNEQEAQKLEESGADYVIVAVLASGGPKPALGYERFVKNLAGGNKDFAPGSVSVEELAQKAKESMEYNQLWGRVAD